MDYACVCCLLLLFVVLCCSLLLFVGLCFWLLVVTGNVTRTRASIIRRTGYITGTCTMAQVSSPDG